MENLTPKFFFDLTSFSHRSLFLEDEPVWETLKNLKSYLSRLELGKIETKIPSGVTLVNPETISIGEGTVVQSGVYIEGPCSIGRECELRHGAFIRSGSVIGDHCVLGHGTEITRAILLDYVSLPHFNYGGDSIFGNRVNCGAGLTCANLRLDRKEVSVVVEKEIFRTGLKKFGTAIGDDSQLGCHAVINPGVLLKKKTLCLPCISLQRSNIKRALARDEL